MTREQFNDDIFQAATPNQLATIFELATQNRETWLRAANTLAAGRQVDLLFVYGLANMVAAHSLSLKQQTELNARYGPEFCSRLLKWYNRTNEVIAALSQSRNTDCGKMKEYYNYLNS